MIYYVLLLLGAYSAAMTAVWLFRVITDGRFNYYLTLLSTTLKTLPTVAARRSKRGIGRIPMPWGW